MLIASREFSPWRDVRGRVHGERHRVAEAARDGGERGREVIGALEDVLADRAARGSALGLGAGERIALRRPRARALLAGVGGGANVDVHRPGIALVEDEALQRMTRAARAVGLELAREVLHDELERRLLVRVGAGERSGLRELAREVALQRRGVGIEAIDGVWRADVDELIGAYGDGARLVDAGVDLRLRERLVGVAAEEPHAAAVLRPAAHLRDDEVAGRELRDAAREDDAGGDDADADAGRGLEVLRAGEAVAEAVGGVGLLAGGLVDRLFLTGVAARGDEGRGEEGGDREAEEEGPVSSRLPGMQQRVVQRAPCAYRAVCRGAAARSDLR